MVTVDRFKGLLAQMERATGHGRIDVLINSGELYRSLGGYPRFLRMACLFAVKLSKRK